MSNHFQQTATDLVKQFQEKSGISLTDNAQELLAQMIAAALTYEIQLALEKMDSVLADLRRDVSKPELGL